MSIPALQPTGAAMTVFPSSRLIARPRRLSCVVRRLRRGGWGGVPAVVRMPRPGLRHGRLAATAGGPRVAQAEGRFEVRVGTAGGGVPDAAARVEPEVVYFWDNGGAGGVPGRPRGSAGRRVRGLTVEELVQAPKPGDSKGDRNEYERDCRSLQSQSSANISSIPPEEARSQEHFISQSLHHG